MAGGWQVELVRGPAAELHGDDPLGRPDGAASRTARWCVVDHPALVLGSAQRTEVADVEACVARGVDLVRRRSGGGAVLIVPGEMSWLDVVVPRADPLWDDDVGRSMWWLGEVWARALTTCGVAGATVHRGPLVHTPWSRLVCFDGVGAGEVVVAAPAHPPGVAKLVGISQRRTRAGARLQSSVHHVWRPDLLCTLLAGEEPSPAQLGPVATLPAAVSPDDLRAAVEAELPG